MRTYGQRAGVYLLMLVIAQLPSMAQKKAITNVNIVFIGNSITHGATLKEPEKEAPPVRTVEWLQTQEGVGKVNFSNQGVSGYTTVDFLPATGKAFRKVEAAAEAYKAEKDALLVFSIDLGTNDSAVEGPNGAPVSPENYKKNLQAIIDQLLTDFPDSRVVVHQPIWYSPNTYNGSIYLQRGLDRLQTYFPEIGDLVKEYGRTKPGQVIVGDKQGFGYFKQHAAAELQAEEGWQGVFYLHPNKVGAESLGKLWGKGIYKLLK